MFQQKLKNSFAFYAAYHQNYVNKIIHMITIPLIILTIFVFLDYLPAYRYIENKYLGDMFAITFALGLIVVYTCIYILLDWRAGLLMIPYILIQYFLANLYYFNIPYAWISALIIFILAWVLQLLGHGIWEGRKPALLDSLVQAFIMAPLFVFMEMLFMCGWRKDLRDEIDDISSSYEPIKV